METIKNYLENMFSRLPNTPEVQKAKYELYQMMEDKYNELISEGKSDNEAIGVVISEFGNLDELSDTLGIKSFIKPQPSMPAAKTLSREAAADFLKNHPKDNVHFNHPVINAIMSVYWPTITCIYLAVSFLTFDWHITWIIWPIAAIISTLINNLLGQDDE